MKQLIRSLLLFFIIFSQMKIASLIAAYKKAGSSPQHLAILKRPGNPKYNLSFNELNTVVAYRKLEFVGEPS